MTNTYHLTDGEEPRPVQVRREGDADSRRAVYVINKDGRETRCEAAWSDGHLRLMVGDRVYACEVERTQDGVAVHLAGHALDVGLLTDRELRRRQRTGGVAGDDSPVVASPMAGRVVKVWVTAGDQIEEGQGLIIIEAMKMENEIKAARDGVIADVYVADGDTVEVAQQLMRYEDQEA